MSCYLWILNIEHFLVLKITIMISRMHSDNAFSIRCKSFKKRKSKHKVVLELGNPHGREGVQW